MRSSLNRVVSLGVALLLGGPSVLGGEPAWTQFRGPSKLGISEEPRAPREWSEGRNVRWKTPLPGEGWSSPLIANGKVWMTAALEEGRSLHALCVDFETGRLLQDVEVFRAEELPPKHRRNSYASPTGILEGDRFYVHFGALGTAALDATSGRKIWENRTLVVDHQNGPGGSLGAHGNLLLVACDGMDRQFEVGLDKGTGREVWRSERSAKAHLETLAPDRRKAYGTPWVTEVDGQPVSLTTASTRLVALDPASGRERWHLDYGSGFSNVPVPVREGNLAVICTGFMKPEIWGIRLGGASGDVSQTHVLWKQKSGAPEESSPLLKDGRVYMVTSGGIASCLRASDGSILWKERLGRDFAASPLWAGGLVYFSDTDGVTTVIRPGDTFEVVSKNTLESGCMASLAVVGRAFVIRTKQALYRIEEASQP
jgi:outer membrane protein assembly factor BamB